MFHVKQRRLLADAEFAEDDIENVLHVDPAGDPPQGPDGEAQILRDELRQARRARPIERRAAVLDGLAMTASRQRRRLAAADSFRYRIGQNG